MTQQIFIDIQEILDLQQNFSNKDLVLQKRQELQDKITLDRENIIKYFNHQEKLRLTDPLESIADLNGQINDLDEEDEDVYDLEQELLEEIDELETEYNHQKCIFEALRTYLYPVSNTNMIQVQTQ